MSIEDFDSSINTLLTKIKSERTKLEQEKKKLDDEKMKISDEKNIWDQQKDEMMSKFLIEDDIVEINVGGQVFSTYLNTLTKIPESILAAMFSGRFPLNKDSNGRIFIDRDPKIFRYILMYLRSGELVYPTNVSEKKLFRNDLSFFNLLPQGKFFKGIFTTLGAKGRNGPTTTGGLYDEQDHGEFVEVKVGRQYFTLPRSGLYKIKAIGACGGDSTENNNIKQGYGAVVTAQVFLEQGTVLVIVVGQQGELARGTSNRAGGGGGGTYICIEEGGTFIPLVIAGGGSGCSWGGFQKNGVNSQTIKKNGDGIGGTATGRGGGGGGFKGNGANNGSDLGGQSFLNGSVGGTGTYAEGGFGGGGGAMYEGGGGGGYNGGDVVDTNQYTIDYPQYGSTSYVSDSVQDSNIKVNTKFEDGKVVFELISG